MIKVENVTKSFSNFTAVKDISFHVSQGEVVGFLGPNGAGKTTTMKLITGFMSPTSGRILVDGLDNFENPLAVKKMIGYLPETPPLYSDMTVLEYLRFVAKLKGLEKNSMEAHLTDILQKMDLSDVKNKPQEFLSKGYKQRVGVAQALIGDPEVLILDEPTVGLDPTQVVEIRQLLKSLKGQHTILLSTHILPEVQAICDRVVIIDQGHIIAEESIQKLAEGASEQKTVVIEIVSGDRHLWTLLEERFAAKCLYMSEDFSKAHVSLMGSAQSVSQLSRYVIEQGHDLLRFEILRESLENVFIKLTAKNNQALREVQS